MAFFGCCRRGAGGDTRAVSNVQEGNGHLAMAPMNPAKPASDRTHVPGGAGADGMSTAMLPGTETHVWQSATGYTSLIPQSQGPQDARAALGTCGLALVYVLVSYLVAVLSYSHINSPGELGRSAMHILRHISGANEIRGWATAADASAVRFLKSEIGQLELSFPGRVETMHQHIPISKDNIFGPFGDLDCREIVTESCALNWGRLYSFSSTECASDCPFDLSKPDGPRCCGAGGPSISVAPGERPPLPAFWSEVLLARAQDSIPTPEELIAQGKQDMPEEVEFANVVFRIKGKGDHGDGSAILVAAHYDSVDAEGFSFKKHQDTSLPTDHGPGIGDDLAGVAVLLEIARTLAAGEPLERDVIFLFVSGEEVGLMGSVLFKEFHPWAHRAAFCINLEGKGVASSKEFLVRSNSGYAANAYARFATRPAGFSFGEWAFANLNIGYTDLSIYRRLGVHGLDLAYVHDSWVYHTPDDNLKYASAAGLEHEGSNVLAIIRGVAADSGFPEPQTRAEDPTVGLWNNEIMTDPGMRSNTVYVGMYDQWMWMMSTTTARVLFGTVAVLSVIGSGALIWLMMMHGSPSFAPAVEGLALAVIGDALVAVAGLVAGMLAAVIAGLVISPRDLRTWYDWGMLRFVYLALAAGLPVLGLEWLRRRYSSRFGGFVAAFFRPQPTDHSALLGVLAVNAVLLVTLAKHLPDLGFAIFWQVLFAPIGLVAEAALVVFVFPLLDSAHSKHPEAAQLLAAESELGGLAGKFATSGVPEFLLQFGAVGARELIGLFVPLVLALPQFFNLLYVFSYMVDSLGVAVGTGALYGLLGSLFGMLFMPAARRLPDRILSVVAAGLGILGVVLMVACFVVPVDTSKYCFFNLHC